MKRGIIFVLMIAFIASSFLLGIGCKATTTETTAAETTAAETTAAETTAAETTAAPVEIKTIRMSVIGGPDEERFKADAAEFEKIHPDIKITLEVAGDLAVYKDTAAQVFAGSDRPDLAWFWHYTEFFEKMVKAGVFEPLDDIYTSEGWVNSLPEPMLEAYKLSDGHFYGICVSTVIWDVIYYRKDAFEKAGIEEPKQPNITLDEFYAITDKLKAAGYEPLSFAGTDAAGGFTELLLDNMTNRTYPKDKSLDLYSNWEPGSTPIGHFTDPDYLEAYAILKTWADKGIVAKGFLGRSYTDALGIWLNGEAAMYVDGSWSAKEQKLPDGKILDYGWFAVPQLKPDIAPAVCLSSANGVVLLKGSKYPKEAKEFLKFILSKERQDAQVKQGLLPVRKDIEVNALYPILREIFEYTTNVAGYDNGIMKWPQEFDALRNQSLIEYLTGQITLEELGKKLEAYVEKSRTQ